MPKAKVFVYYKKKHKLSVQTETLLALQQMMRYTELLHNISTQEACGSKDSCNDAVDTVNYKDDH